MAVSVYTGAGGGVASFNGRKGNVVPANGDYTKAQVGLGNVDNTSDANKPISNATQAALNDKQAKITASGLLKGDGAGGVTTAIKGTDYVASPEVFIATYGTTTSAEIEAAYQAGKPIIAIHPSRALQYHIFQRSSSTNHKFSTFAINGKFFTIQCVNDVWSDGQNSGVRPSIHAATHASGGTDPITPADVGAQPSISANGILKGDGSGNITAASETEVELVSLPNICNPNLLDNWYFGNPVNQRGASYVENDYGLDRWKGTYGVDVNGTMGFNPSGFAIQGLEDSVKSILDGMMLTASILYVNGTLHSGTAVYTKTGNAHNFIDSGSIQFNNQADGNILLYAQSADQIVAVKLELGSQQTLAHQENGAWVLNEIPDYGEQLRRCQRYCVAFNTYDCFFPVGNNDFVVELPGPMRATQTIINPQNITNANVTNPTVAWYNIGSNQLRLRSTASHDGFQAFCNGLVLFSADL